MAREKNNGTPDKVIDITAATKFFDFNATLKSMNDRAAGYLVTYIESETDRPDVIMERYYNFGGEGSWVGRPILLGVSAGGGRFAPLSPGAPVS